MTQDRSYLFETSISRVGYSSKEEAKRCLYGKAVQAYNKTVDDPSLKLHKMAFKRTSLTVEEFAEKATSGYTFCNLFSYDPARKYTFRFRQYTDRAYPEYQRGANKGYMKMQMKSDDYYEGTQCFFVDIDYTKYSNVQEFIDALKLPPTVVYMSYSDATYKKDRKQEHNPKYDEDKGIWSRRFRLCYVFDEIILGEKKFIELSTSINTMVERSIKEQIQDTCGKQMSQYFNGTQNKNEVYVLGYIYSKEDFLPHTAATYYNEFPSEGQFGMNLLNLPSVTATKLEYTCQYTTPSDRFINDMSRLGYDEFMAEARHRYRYHYRKDDGVWIDRCQTVDEDYFALYYNVSPLKDGDHRRKKLFERMCLRRVMFPDITPNEVLYNAYEDLHRFVDNREDPITIECLVRNVINAFRLTIEEIEKRYSKVIAYLKSRAPKNRLIYDTRGCQNPAERNTRMKEIRWSLYDKEYNTELSLKENAEKLNVNVKTLRTYCRDRGIEVNNKVTDEELMLLVDKELSIRKNITNLKECYDISISKDRVSSILKRTTMDNNTSTTTAILPHTAATCYNEFPSEGQFIQWHQPVNLA